MGRIFDGSTSGAAVNLGDITTARFPDDSPWTVLGFFRISSTNTADENTMISKWNNAASDRSFTCRIDNGAEPQNLQVLYSDQTILAPTDAVFGNTWYLMSVSGDGAGAGSMALTGKVFDMDEVQISSSGPSGSLTETSGRIAPIRIGERQNNDEMEGDLAYVAYINSELTQSQILEYLRDPTRVVAQFQGTGVGVEFFMPLGLGDPEPDWSGNGVTGSVHASTSVGANPPVTQPYAGVNFAYSAAAAAPDTPAPGFLAADYRRRVHSGIIRR